MPIIEYHIPRSTQIVVVADFFAQDLQGGAELTTEATIRILEDNEYRVFRLHSNSLTEQIVSDNPNVIYLLTNWSQAPLDGIAALARGGAKYVVIEYDYKYCLHRSSHLHLLQEKKLCDCDKQKQGKFVEAFYLRSQHTFFMSEGQRQEYLRLFPRMKANESKFSVLSSVWLESDLDRLVELNKTPKNNKWAVLQGGSWIKAQQATEEYCKKIGLEYELIGGLPYSDFIKKLSEYKGLVFHPAGFDTCPRLVVEAKLLGLKLDLNNNVQHKDEEWFTEEDNEKTLEYLKSSSQRLMTKLKV